jgi:lysophospholipase L1-like esterase
VAADLPATYARGFSYGIVNTGGWPGTGVGIWLAFKFEPNSDATLQIYSDNAGALYSRYGTTSWTAWSGLGGHITTLALADAITLYPEGTSTMAVLSSNGWPENGQALSVYNGSNAGSQLVFGISGEIYKRRYNSGGPWSAFEALGGSGGGGSVTNDEATQMLLRNVAQIATVTETLTGSQDSVASPSLYFTTGTFKGYLAKCSNSGTIDTVIVPVQPNSIDGVTRVKVFIYNVSTTTLDGDTLGSLIVEKEIMYSGKEDRLDLVPIRLDAPVVLPASVAIGYHADGHIALYGKSGSGSGGSRPAAFVAPNTSDIDSPTWNAFGAGSLPADVWVRTGSKSDAYTVALNSSLVSGLGNNEAVINTHKVRDFVDAISNRIYGASNKLIKVAFIGDSLTARGESSGGYFQELSELLYSEYGFGGAGWITLTTAATEGGQPTDMFSTVVTNGGDITFVDETSAKGLHAGHTLLGISGTVGFGQVVSFFSEAKIYWIRQSGGGEFRYQIDGGAWTTVNTAGAEAHQITTISGLTRDVHTLRIEGLSGVSMINGVELLTEAGIVLYNLANGGADTNDYAPLSATTVWRNALTAIAPNLVLIALGTNDKRLDIPTGTYTTNIGTMITGIRTARALTDIVLVAPNDHDPTAPGTATMGDFATALRAYANTNGHCFISVYDLAGPYADMNSRGWMDGLSPSFHWSEEGGRVQARLFYHRFFRTMQDVRRPVTDIAMHANGSAALSMTNLAAAETRLTNSVRGRTQIDLSPYRQIMIVAEPGTASTNANARAFLRYATTIGGTYNAIGDTSVGSNETISLATGPSVDLKTVWIELPEAAKTNVWLDIATIDGNGTGDNPTIASVHIRLR